MATLTAQQIYALAVDAGFTRAQAATMTAIALAESGGKTDVVNQNRNGSTDTGLWQINSVHGFSQSALKDPRQNAAAAKKVYDGQGFGAWVVYNEGTYKDRQYTQPALQAAASTSGVSIPDILKQIPVLGNLIEGAQGGVSGVQDVGHAASQAVDLAARAGTFLSNPRNWIRIVYVALGASLVIGALFIVAKPVAEPVVELGAKAVDVAL